eukprot:6864401-Pyramimonas_sp.AAC.1
MMPRLAYNDGTRFNGIQHDDPMTSSLVLRWRPDDAPIDIRSCPNRVAIPLRRRSERFNHDDPTVIRCMIGVPFYLGCPDGLPIDARQCPG